MVYLLMVYFFKVLEAVSVQRQEDARLWFDFKAWCGANFSGLSLDCRVRLWSVPGASSCILVHRGAQERHDGANLGHWR